MTSTAYYFKEEKTQRDERTPLAGQRDEKKGRPEAKQNDDDMSAAMQRTQRLPRAAEINPVCSPGPGAYDPNINAMHPGTSHMRYTHAGKPKVKDDNAVPGPGAYEWDKRLPNSNVYPQGPEHAFPRATQFVNTAAAHIPGVGAYMDSTFRTSAPSYSMASRMAKSSSLNHDGRGLVMYGVTQTPGRYGYLHSPGADAYNPNHFVESQKVHKPLWSQSKATRFHFGPTQLESNRTIYVSNVPSSSTKQDLEAAFSSCGAVESVRFRRGDRAGASSKAPLTAMLQFATIDGALNATDPDAEPRRIGGAQVVATLSPALTVPGPGAYDSISFTSLNKKAVSMTERRTSSIHSYAGSFPMFGSSIEKSSALVSPGPAAYFVADPFTCKPIEPAPSEKYSFGHRFPQAIALYTNSITNSAAQYAMEKRSKLGVRKFNKTAPAIMSSYVDSGDGPFSERAPNLFTVGTSNP